MNLPMKWLVGSFSIPEPSPGFNASSEFGVCDVHIPLLGGLKGLKTA